MSAKNICRKEIRAPVARAMDVTMIATTVGGAAIANMIFPSITSAIIGAVLGAVIGYRATESA
ncbi:hypothetical protein ABH912_000527 [Pseudomonas sp. BT76 TE3572]|uniref:hypothetical protein n=1 Tax=Pseudomonas sp. BT76 TE3572 TaxID=3349325 RepID=UPI003D21D7A8